MINIFELYIDMSIHKNKMKKKTKKNKHTVVFCRNKQSYTLLYS